MSSEIAVAEIKTVADIAQLVLTGDMRRLTPDQKVSYYKAICDAAGLDFRLRPFQYIVLNGREVLYADKGCAEQLRAKHGITVTIADRQTIGDVYVVTARATLPSGRSDEATGAVTIGGLKGDALCNALMKAETKAKRRVTLSICGLGMLDESELATIPRSSIGDGGDAGNGTATPSLRDALGVQQPTPEPAAESPDVEHQTPTRSQVEVLRELCGAVGGKPDPADAIPAAPAEPSAKAERVKLDEAEEARLFGEVCDAAAQHGFTVETVERYLASATRSGKGKARYQSDPAGFYRAAAAAAADGRLNAQFAKYR